ncbi:hypothetical protein PGT21_028253 [Puccinia graminis f. sp. tritici]|uniref:Uncharacterized protein n=1 Tax=Puccinia graminis f. sp. tritici TaxID=56615 RepID=A0A5B0PV71_PUCGR|nr:hypothetical protein PGTUg99_012512 [Puccinia graminis f. sp. tritici]KAA1104620.1 hypothetical protein PGT21_028253 [Puccinia graminis f. sp. tritici]
MSQGECLIPIPPTSHHRLIPVTLHSFLRSSTLSYQAQHLKNSLPLHHQYNGNIDNRHHSDRMFNFINFAFVASALCLATVESRIPIGTERNLAASKVDSVYKPLQVTRAQVLDKRHLPQLPENENLADFTPTPVIPQTTSDNTRRGSEKLNRRTFGQFSFKQIKVHAYLVECLNGIVPHVQLIRNLCAGEFNGDAERLGWSLVAELQEILNILNGCLAKIKSCGTAPTPSGAPGGRTPSLGDICQILFRIMCEIRDCCLVIGALCTKYVIVRQICHDTLTQITSCLASIAISLGAEVGNIFTGLGRLIATMPHFFVGVQFGFDAIPGILGDGKGFFSFNAFL